MKFWDTFRKLENRPAFVQQDIKAEISKMRMKIQKEKEDSLLVLRPGWYRDDFV